MVSKAIRDSLAGALEKRLCGWESFSWAMIRELESSEFEIRGYFESEAEARESWRPLHVSEPHLGERACDCGNRGAHQPEKPSLQRSGGFSTSG